MSAEPHTSMDPTADWCADEVGALAESLGCSYELARRIQAQMDLRVEQELLTERGVIQAEVIRRLCGEFLDVGGNLRVQFFALLLATGLIEPMKHELARLMRIKPGEVEKIEITQAMVARYLGVHRANVSHFMKRWESRLGLKGGEFSRGAETAENCRAARLRVVQRSKT